MAHIKTLPLFAVLALAAACSQPGVKSSPLVVAESQAQQPVQPAVEAAAQPAAEPVVKDQPDYPKQSLTPDILFKPPRSKLLLELA